MIHIEQLHLKAGTFSLSNVTLSVPDGTYAVLMGETGSGKTTLIEAVCGLRPIVSGRITVGGQRVDHIDPALRGIGYVPQDGALFSSMTVREQIGLPLRVRRLARRDVQRRVEAMADLLGITELLSRMPARLSGGERQRVALARAVVFEPGVVCLDEPFSALDEPAREAMYETIDHLREKTGLTALHVTHNSSEATRLGDTLFRLEHGSIVRANKQTNKSANDRTKQQSNE